MESIDSSKILFHITYNPRFRRLKLHDGKMDKEMVHFLIQKYNESEILVLEDLTIESPTGTKYIKLMVGAISDICCPVCHTITDM